MVSSSECGEQAGHDGRAHAEIDLTLAMRGAHLRQEGHQGAHDQDRLEALSQHDHERLDEEIDRGHRLQGTLRLLQRDGQPALDRLELRRRRGARAGAGPERGEGGLDLGRDVGILGPQRPLHLLERHVGVERPRGGGGIAGARHGERRCPPGPAPGRTPARSPRRRCRPGTTAPRPPARARRGRRCRERRARRESVVGHLPGGRERPERWRHLARGSRQPEHAGVQRDGPAVGRGKLCSNAGIAVPTVPKLMRR